MPDAFLILIFLIAAVALVVVVCAFISDQRRRQALAAWAANHGMTFRRERDRSFSRRFPAFSCFREGQNRFAHNLIEGSWRGRRFLGFDYHYQVTTGSGKNRSTHTHRFSGVLIFSELPLRPLVIRPEGLSDRIAGFFGARSINFESAEFSRRFYVHAEDRKWAYDVIHPRTMEFLLGRPIFHIEFDRDVVLARLTKVFDPEDYEVAADVVCGILDGLPEYLVKQLKAGPV
jgi:hypothetical protein